MVLLGFEWKLSHCACPGLKQTLPQIRCLQRSRVKGAIFEAPNQPAVAAIFVDPRKAPEMKPERLPSRHVTFGIGGSHLPVFVRSQSRIN